MSDRYIDFANSPIGLRLVGALGLPSPVRLERWQAGRLRPIEGALLLGGGPLIEAIGTFAKRLTDGIFVYGAEPTLATEWIPGHGRKSRPWCMTPAIWPRPTSSSNCGSFSSH